MLVVADAGPPRLKPLLDALRTTGFRLSDRVYRSGLAQVGESEEV